MAQPEEKKEESKEESKEELYMGRTNCKNEMVGTDETKDCGGA